MHGIDIKFGGWGAGMPQHSWFSERTQRPLRNAFWSQRWAIYTYRSMPDPDLSGLPHPLGLVAIAKGRCPFYRAVAAIFSLFHEWPNPNCLFN